ncbi:MAG: SRPBCC family protein [Bacteroidales bacterium]|nr:SRPBCC family protein [Bacteroidales bacterium]
MPVFQATQIVKADLDVCWKFFSDPANLSLITPPDMNFRIIFPQPLPAMYPGMIIRYHVSPLLGVKLEWITEITQVREREFFIDNQLKGPFSIWHHQHFFRQTPEGTEMKDIVTYEVPFGRIGTLFAGTIVRKRIEGIFTFRHTVIEKYFNAAG